MNGPLDYDYVRDFVAGKIIPTCNELAASDHLSKSERICLLSVCNALALLPYIDGQTEIFLEIDFYWEGKNWLGRLSFEEGIFKLWSNLCEEQGNPPELCAEWQRAAVRISAQHGVEDYDQGHLWFWADCFKRFVRAHTEEGTSSTGVLSLVAPAGDLRIVLPHADERIISS